MHNRLQVAGGRPLRYGAAMHVFSRSPLASMQNRTPRFAPCRATPRVAASLPPLSWKEYAQINRRLDAAIASPRVCDKLHFLHRDYNRQVAPRLHTEEAALQYLSNKLAYLYLPPGAPIALHIERNLAGEEEISYPRWLRLHWLLPPGSDGPVAMFLRPAGLRRLRRTQRSVLLARGTAAVDMDALALTLGYPTGIRADFYPHGPGLQDFEKHCRVLMPPIERALDAGRPLTFTGHSLGGAWATYAMAALPATMQARTRLITFSAPGVARSVARGIRVPRREVRLVRDRFDFVPKAGPTHPTGDVLVPTFLTPPGERRSPHCAAPLAVQELLGRPLDYERRHGWWHDTWTPLEGPRWLLGTMLGESLPA